MIAAAVVAGALVVGGPVPGTPIPAAAFGQHTSLASPPAGVTFTSVRLWDNGVRWDEIESAQGRYNWAALDTAVDKAQAAGATDILYVLGSTPSWAARDPNMPGLYGNGTTSLPSRPEYYLDFVREVVKRYQGRITAYQIWNEANTRSFYEGDWTALARLTRRSYDVIKLHDPAAQVVSASSTVIPDDLFATESFFVRYARALHAAGDPIDAMSVHLYPVDTSKGPDSRAASIIAAQEVLNKVGIDRPLWDTEVNYGDRRPGLPQVVPDPTTGATYVARTYIDSATQGIARTYWYGWDLHTLGVDLVDDAGVTPAGRAFLTVRDWLTGARPGGCQDVAGTRRCRFLGEDGVPFTVLWATSSPITLSTPGLQLCRIDGTCVDTEESTTIDSQPVLLK